MDRFGWFLVAAAACAPATGASRNDAGGGADASGGSDAQVEREREVAARLEAVRNDPGALAAFLGDLPKGAGLHGHLSGEVATESLIAWGGLEGLCVRTSDFMATFPPCDAVSPALATATPGTGLFGQVVDAWSMEGAADAPVLDRHRHFFATFGKFGEITSRRAGSMIAEARRIAGRERVQYLELMTSLGSATGGTVGVNLVSPSDPWDDDTLQARRTEILAAPELASGLAEQRARLDEWEATARAELGCDGASPDPGCEVEVRYLVQISRTQTREWVFGAFVWGFELVRLDPRVVGVNVASAEDDPTSLANYEAHMQALDVLNRVAPVHVSLHAGELIPSLLPAGDEVHLTFHIRQAIELGHAERIGHGVAVATEDDSTGLLQEMAERRVLVETCLTSNQQLLGVEGAMHPLGDYLAAGVPVALATDDGGVLRTTISAELQRAVTDHGLRYQDLKAMARHGIDAAFLPGGSLRDQAACADALVAEQLDDACRAFLDGSQKASAQWRLETALVAFEEAHRE